MKHKTLNAAIVGLGVGERHIQAYKSESRCNLVKLCDIDKNKLKEVGENHSECKLTINPNDIFNDPNIDIVSIASYDNFHAEQVIKAVKSGKHVFVEKPICLTEDELISISKALTENPNVKISSNFVLRKSPQFLDVKNAILKKKFGKLYYLEGDYNYGRVHKITKGWRGDIPNYSVMHGGGIHLIDLISWLIDEPAVEVNAIGNKIVTDGTKFSNLDMITALIRFKNNIIVKITSNYGSVTPHHHRLSVYGTKSTFFHSQKGGVYYFKREDENDKKEINKTFDNSSKINVLKSFICHILDGSNPDVTSKEVLDAMAISLAIEKSLDTKNWEKIRFVTS
ncbi:MAG: Gfo/Idh/MocA family oxidoreductase [Flavobacteriaceae bacterium]|jgi:predicted dehydrogenase|nr:Gfo/Idh/MocA family oxidoreductase [Flavobacteriaceae bacterium]MBT6353366.1 Gfo/Idh/MocA family oxidoreductase [Pelagibacteraceae bacterium]